ncbi:MAG TPA: flagellar basal body-associated FliL family protein [Fontimonas sp.]
MAQSKAAAIDDEAAAPAAKAAVAAPAKGGGMMMLVGAVVLSTAASAGISWFFSHRTEAAMQASLAHATDGEGGEVPAAETPKAPPLYQTMEPAFVVNLEAPDHARYLQTQIELMARDSAALEAVGRYNPRIRNAILLLLGQQQIADLTTREGKEKLQAAVLAEIQKILKEETGSPGIEAVYFSSFVMQ